MKSTVGFLILCLLGCNYHKDVEVSPVLMEKLELIIDKYEAYCEENWDTMSNPPVYKVNFWEAKGDCFVVIGTNMVYEAEMDGCLLYNDNLISFHILNDECNSFVNFDPSTKCQELTGFEKAYIGMGNYRSVNWTYKVVGDSLAIYDQKAFPVE